MGLLDEAIREHLDLKRRRGADPTEVERAEREALGPVRRGPEEPLVAAQPEEPAAVYDDYDEEYEDDVDESWDELTGEHEAPVAAAAPAAPTPHEYDDEYEDDDELPLAAEVAPGLLPDGLDPESAPGELRFASDGEEFDDEPLPHAAPPDPAAVVRGDEHIPPPAGLGETVEYDVERAIEAEQGERTSEEDVLEETPEFLQETPDHDRLWFEQRPPRDFDFDG